MSQTEKAYGIINAEAQDITKKLLHCQSLMKNKTEQITVIIPVYNTEKFLEKSVRSIMNQTYKNLNIICVNDGSTDGSLAILEKLAKEDERITIINQKNAGLGGARNTGLDHATTEWISFIDSDDLLHQNAFEILSKVLDTNIDFIHFGTEIRIEDGITPIKSDDKYYAIKYNGLTEVTDLQFLESDTSACNKLFRKSILDKHNIRFEKILYEDFQFTHQYLSVSKYAYYVPEKLYIYLRRNNSIMFETFKKTPRAIDHLYAYNYVYEFLEKNNLLEKHKNSMIKLFPDCYFFVIKFGTTEIIPTAVKYATELYDKYTLLQKEIIKTTQNRTIVFKIKKKLRQKSTSSLILEKIFSIKNEYYDYTFCKIIRLFGIIIYKKPKK